MEKFGLLVRELNTKAKVQVLAWIGCSKESVEHAMGIERGDGVKPNTSDIWNIL